MTLGWGSMRFFAVFAMCMCLPGWVDFRVVTGNLDYYFESRSTRRVRRAKFSHALVWTPTLRCGHLSGPSRTRGGFFDFKVGGHDGAYKGRVHVIVPFVGQKNGNLIDRQQSYNVLVLRVPGLEEGVMFGGKAL